MNVFIDQIVYANHLQLITISLVCVCLNHFTTTDINECSTNNGGCDHYCHNSAGSYSCSCYSNYQLNSDNHTCNGQ